MKKLDIVKMHDFKDDTMDLLNPELIENTDPNTPGP